MKNNFYLIFTLFILTACNNEHQEKTANKAENTVKSSSIKEVKIEEKNDTKPIVTKVIPKAYTFTFEDLKQHSTTLHIKNDLYFFSNIKQPIVMIFFFATWCPTCIGQIPHLSSLQKKFKKNLFILSSLVYDDCSNKKLKKFLIAQKAAFFTSSRQKENLKFANFITPKLGLTQNFPMPLMILFVNGKYFTHYEGMMPEEMIESDIKQVLNKITQ